MRLSVSLSVFLFVSLCLEGWRWLSVVCDLLRIAKKYGFPERRRRQRTRRTKVAKRSKEVWVCLFVCVCVGVGLCGCGWVWVWVSENNYLYAVLLVTRIFLAFPFTFPRRARGRTPVYHCVVLGNDAISVFIFLAAQKTLPDGKDSR